MKNPAPPIEGQAMTPRGSSSLSLSSLKLLIGVALLCTAGVAQAQSFTNSLGMKMVPVPGTKILMATTEVTVDQYKAAGLGYKPPEFAQQGSHPAVNVSWDDAVKYCAWLSKKEGKKYRLPTDYEWSCAVGIGEQEGHEGSPESKDKKIPDVFPWGRGKPPSGAGNYSGEEWLKSDAAKAYLGESEGEQEAVFPGYDDGIVFTAPVGSFEPNSLGIYDLGGNVWEWCEEKLNPESSARVLRGGAWGGCTRPWLLSSARNDFSPDRRSDLFGFRVVCEPH